MRMSEKCRNNNNNNNSDNPLASPRTDGSKMEKAKICTRIRQAHVSLFPAQLSQHFNQEINSSI